MPEKKPARKLGKKDMKRIKGGDAGAVARKAGEKPVEYLKIKLDDIQISSF